MSQSPFFPPRPPTSEEQAPWAGPDPPAPHIGPPEIECDNPYCGEPIFEHEPAVSIFVGVVGRSRKSGYASIVAGKTISSTVRLHIWCVTEYSKVEIFEEETGDDLCVACSNRLDKDMDE